MATKKEQKESEGNTERATIIRADKLLDAMDHIRESYIPDGAYQSMWEELYLKVNDAIEKAENKAQEEEDEVEDDGEDESVEEYAEEPEPIPIKKQAPTGGKLHLKGDDDDLLA